MEKYVYLSMKNKLFVFLLALLSVSGTNGHSKYWREYAIYHHLYFLCLQGDRPCLIVVTISIANNQVVVEPGEVHALIPTTRTPLSVRKAELGFHFCYNPPLGTLYYFGVNSPGDYSLRLWVQYFSQP